MPLEYKPSQKILYVDQLTAEQCAQVRLAGKLYDGKDLPAEDRIAPHVEGGDAFYDPRHREIHVDGVHAYDAWSYNVDSGTHFVANTTEIVAETIQSTLELSRATPAAARFAELFEASKRS